MAYKVPYLPPLPQIIQILNVNGKNSGSTIMQKSSPLGKFYPMNVSFELVSVSGLVTASTVSLGSNSATYNNIMAATLLTNLTTALDIRNITLNTGLVTLAANTDVYLNVTGVATATTFNFNVYLLGWVI